MISKSFHLWLFMVNAVAEGCRMQTVGPLEAKMQKLLDCFGSDAFNDLFIGPG